MYWVHFNYELISTNDDAFARSLFSSFQFILQCLLKTCILRCIFCNVYLKYNSFNVDCRAWVLMAMSEISEQVREVISELNYQHFFAQIAATG